MDQMILDLLETWTDAWEKETEVALTKPGSCVAACRSYNDRLAEAWTEGAVARRQGVDLAERTLFARWVDAPNSKLDAAARTILLIDWGGGTGKAIPWIRQFCQDVRPLVKTEIVYLYIDISPAMLRAARNVCAVNFIDDTKSFRAFFALVDVTAVSLRDREWRTLRSAFREIISMCAGGTAGNFGLEITPNTQRQMTLFEQMRNSDHALITFLDARFLLRAIQHYARSGPPAGRFDHLVISLYSGDSHSPNLVQPSVDLDLCNLAIHDGVHKLEELIRSLLGKPFAAVIEMRLGDRKVGQVTRHYSPEYAEEHFLMGYKLQQRVQADGAVCYWLAGFRR